MSPRGHQHVAAPRECAAGFQSTSEFGPFRRSGNPLVQQTIGRWLCLAALFLCGLLAGCSNSTSEDPPTAKTAAPGSGGDSETTLTSDAQTKTPAENPAPGQDSPAMDVLQRMAKVYRDAKTYADAGVARMQYRGDGEQVNQEFPFSVSFQRPNKLRLQVYEGQIVSDGERVHGMFDDVKGYVVASDAPAKLTPEAVYADAYLRVMLTQRQVGAALQIMFLLTDNAVDMLLDQANAAPPKLLKPETLDGQLHDRVQLTSSEGAMVFWIDQKTSLLRRVEYPIDGLRQYLQQGGEVSGLAVVADFVGAQVNRPIDPAAFKFETPEGVKEVKRFVGPTPPEILGRAPGDV